MSQQPRRCWDLPTEILGVPGWICWLNTQQVGALSEGPCGRSDAVTQGVSGKLLVGLWGVESANGVAGGCSGGSAYYLKRLSTGTGTARTVSWSWASDNPSINLNSSPALPNYLTTAAKLCDGRPRQTLLRNEKKLNLDTDHESRVRPITSYLLQ